MLPAARSLARVLGVLGDEISIIWLRTVTLLSPSSFAAIALETRESERTTSGRNPIMFLVSVPVCLKIFRMSQGAIFIVAVAEKFPSSVKTTSTSGTSSHSRPCALR